MQNSISKLFKTLSGNWKLSRQIISPHTTLILTGHASFSAHDINTKRYHETGINPVNDGRHKYFRDYDFHYCPSNRNISVQFVHNNQHTGLFYQINSPCGQAKHLCGGDTYQVYYDFSSLPGNYFQLIFNVKGINKHYLASTVFQRI